MPSGSLSNIFVTGESFVRVEPSDIDYNYGLNALWTPYFLLFEIKTYFKVCNKVIILLFIKKDGAQLNF